MNFFHPDTPADIPWSLVEPGDTVFLQGTHGGGSFTGLLIEKSGAPNAPITIKGAGVILNKYYVNFDGCSWITFDNIEIHNCGQVRGEDSTNITVYWSRFHGLHEDNIRLIEPHPGNDDWKILNCFFGVDSALSLGIPNPIYSLIDGGTKGAERLTVLGCAMVETYLPLRDTDCHAIGIQGGSNHVVRQNYTFNTGTAIALWTPKEAQSKNNRIEGNNCVNAQAIAGGSIGSMIEISGTYNVALDLPRVGWRAGNIIKNNLGDGAVYGIRAAQARDAIAGLSTNVGGTFGIVNCSVADIYVFNPFAGTTISSRGPVTPTVQALLDAYEENPYAQA